VLFRSIGKAIVHPSVALNSMAISDVSEAQLLTAAEFLDSIYGDGDSRAGSRAQTPMSVSTQTQPQAQSSQAQTQTQMYPLPTPTPSWGSYKSLLGLSTMLSPNRGKTSSPTKESIRPVTGFGRITRSVAKLRHNDIKESSAFVYPTVPAGVPSSARRAAPSIATLPHAPNIDHITVPIEEQCEFAIVISMYEVYNDKIFDLLTDSPSTVKTAPKRKQVLFKNTSWSQDRKVVTGLKKIVCGSLEEALLVLETGLQERRVTGTGSNAVSSRSHGFFCIEVKKKRRMSNVSHVWYGNSFTIVDLAGMLLGCQIVLKHLLTIPGSERARVANTAGATLAEAGKINESLMYLGQCMQIQGDISTGVSDPSTIVPYRQCKLTELLFSNSFSAASTSNPQQSRQQKAVMIVTADARGDFNATSQILRYSALAREVTVPRIPSVTSTLFSTAATTTTTATTPHNHAVLISPTSTAPSTNPRLPCTTCATHAVEIATLQSALEEERATHAKELETQEYTIRAECWDSFELELDKQRARWQEAWEEERERVEAHGDNKLEVLAKALAAEKHDEDDDSADDHADGTKVAAAAAELEEMRRVLRHAKREKSALQEEVRELKQKNEGLVRERQEQREKSARTPSRKVKVLKARPWNVVEAEGMEGLEMDVENSRP